MATWLLDGRQEATINTLHISLLRQISVPIQARGEGNGNPELLARQHPA
jgi:hypothetical protein